MIREWINRSIKKTKEETQNEDKEMDLWDKVVSFLGETWNGGTVSEEGDFGNVTLVHMSKDGKELEKWDLKEVNKITVSTTFDGDDDELDAVTVSYEEDVSYFLGQSEDDIDE